MKDFNIRLNGIKNNSSYFFEIKNSFFSEYNFSDIKEGHLNININVKKNNSSYLLGISIIGEIYNLLCDICADRIIIPIEEQVSIILRENENHIESNHEIIYIRPNQNVFNIKDILFEIITLSIPNKRVHRGDRDSKCDQKMLKTIKKYIIQDKVKNTPDPRWEVLKNIT